MNSETVSGPSQAPTRRQARLIIASLGGFWAFWALTVSTSQVTHLIPLTMSGFVGGMGCLFSFFFFAYRVQGVRWFAARSPFAKEAKSQWKAYWSLLSPRWWRSIIRASEWPFGLVVLVLAVLLACDLVLLIFVLPGYTRPVSS